jgi:hypothetical protein
MFNPEGYIVISLLIQYVSLIVGSAGLVLSIMTISQSFIKPLCLCKRFYFDEDNKVETLKYVLVINTVYIYRVSQKKLIHLIFKWITKVSVFFDSPCIYILGFPDETQHFSSTKWSVTNILQVILITTIHSFLLFFHTKVNTIAVAIEFNQLY